MINNKEKNKNREKIVIKTSVINIILNRPDFDCHKNSKPVIIYMKIMLATACKKTKPQRVFTLSLAFLNK